MKIQKIIKSILPKFVVSWLILQYRRIKYYSLIRRTHKHYKELEERLWDRKGVVRFAAYVVYDASFSAYKLMELMLADKESYSAKIVICPDVCRGDFVLREQYKKTKKFFVQKYGRDCVIDGYDLSTGEYIDPSDKFDIIYLANPYDGMVNIKHSVKYLSHKNVLPIYISYCFQPNKYVFKYVMPLLEISLFWKVFTDTKYTANEYKRFELYRGKNVFLTGYGKMDSLSDHCIENKRERKKIIVAPHHTITNNDLPLSNFLKYADYILSLSKRFTDVDFVFRPHPLLFINLVNEGFWKQEDVDVYIQKLKDSGIEYSYGGDYFSLFINSDALIHDCSSYMVEYLYCNKPCCFCVKNKNIFSYLSKLGKLAMKCHVLAYSEKDIDDFINSVRNDNILLKFEYRKKILPNIMVNYPDASRKILESISNTY